MRGSKSSVLTFAEKCKNILASNWQGNLNTIKADAKGSKDEIYSSKVKYFFNRGKPYIWVPEKDFHNVNTIIDERGSFAVTCPFPGPLRDLMKSIKRLPARVALLGDVVPLKEKKAKLARETLLDTILSEERVIKECGYSVSSLLTSCNLGSTSRSHNLQELLDSNTHYVIYKFNLSSCMYIDLNGGTHEVALENMEACNADPLSHFSSSLIDGINQSEARRRALILFCVTHLNRNAKDQVTQVLWDSTRSLAHWVDFDKSLRTDIGRLNINDAFMLSVDRKGFDVLGKVLGPVKSDGSPEYEWKEFRFTFKEEAANIETFCRQLVEMEEEALKSISAFSGI